MLKYVVLSVICVVKAFLIASLLITLFSSVSAKDPCSECCFSYTFMPHIYKYFAIMNGTKQIYQGSNRITQLAYNVKERAIYFIFGHYWERRVASINIVSKQSIIYHEIAEPTGISVNQWTSNVYIGTTNGIYRIKGWTRSKTGRSERIPIRNMRPGQRYNVENIFFEGHVTYYKPHWFTLTFHTLYVEVIYFSNNQNFLYVLENGLVSVVDEVEGFPVEKIVYYDDTIFFTQGNNLFRVKMGNRSSIVFYEKFRDKLTILTSDTTNRPYVATIHDKVYVLDTENDKEQYNFKILGHVDGLTALTFDERGDPIFATEDSLVMLKYSGCFFTYTDFESLQYMYYDPAP